MKKAIFTVLSIMVLASMSAKGNEDVISMIRKVNDKWQATHKPQCRGFWDNAAYFTGNMEAMELTQEQAYLDYTIAWCEYNKWQGARQTDTSKWEYKTYGEDHNHVLFADWQICFQVYIDLYKMTGKTPDSPDYRLWIDRALEVMNYQASTEANDYWWWSDALYMGMPIFTKLYTVTHDEKLLEKQYE